MVMPALAQPNSGPRILLHYLQRRSILGVQKKTDLILGPYSQIVFWAHLLFRVNAGL